MFLLLAQKENWEEVCLYGGKYPRKGYPYLWKKNNPVTPSLDCAIQLKFYVPFFSPSLKFNGSDGSE